MPTDQDAVSIAAVDDTAVDKSEPDVRADSVEVAEDYQFLMHAIIAYTDECDFAPERVVPHLLSQFVIDKTIGSYEFWRRHIEQDRARRLKLRCATNLLELVPCDPHLTRRHYHRHRDDERRCERADCRERFPHRRCYGRGGPTIRLTVVVPGGGV